MTPAPEPHSPRLPGWIAPARNWATSGSRVSCVIPHFHPTVAESLWISAIKKPITLTFGLRAQGGLVTRVSRLTPQRKSPGYGRGTEILWPTARPAEVLVSEALCLNQRPA